MFDRLKRKREITDLEKNEIIIEWLRDRIEGYNEMAYADPIPPIELLELILHFEVRKHFFMTNADNYNYVNRAFERGS